MSDFTEISRTIYFLNKTQFQSNHCPLTIYVKSTYL